MNELFLNYGRMHGAWTRGLYFHFRFKIWRHHRVPRPRLPIGRGNFGDLAINKRYIAYFSLRMRETAVSTSGVKSDVTIVFLDPDLLQNARISAIRVHLRQILDFLIFAWVFRTSWLKIGVLRGGGKIGEGVVRYWPPTNSFLLFGILTSVPILVKIDQEIRPWECPQTDRHTHRQTDRHTDANRFYNLSHAICYSYGTDNNLGHKSV